MKKLNGKLAGVVGAVAMVAAGAGMSEATATWTVDLTGITSDITTIGTSLLALAVVMYGFRVARGMVRR